MQIHVAQNGEKTGPFEREEVLRRLVAGDLKGSDLGWHEGLADWEPLSKLIPPPARAPVAMLPQSSGMAIVSLVCGILGFVTLGLGSIPAIITGHLARSRINKSAGALGGGGLALAGLILGYVCLVLTFVAILASLAVPAFSSIQQKAIQTKTMSQAKQIVVGMKLYAAEHEGSLPPTLATLYEEDILDDGRMPDSPVGKESPAAAWDYRGAGLKDTADGTAIVLVSRKADRAKKKIVARLDGTVELLLESEVP
ncbi:MAG TPA: hypothetical protein DDZ88_08620 [Verrucomicrobiales bacterium]|nr:hypothetical protein [Verrucomicrobiales bacterium]